MFAPFLLFVIVAAPPREADGPADLVDKAYAAAAEKRWCDAIPLFLSLHERAPQPKHLYRAAEVAFAAGDHRLALDLYRSVIDAYPKFDKRAAVEARIKDVTAVMKGGGAGSACADPPSLCGDWIIRPGEQCDDGNTTDGDGCDRNCTLPACGNGVLLAPEKCDDGNLTDGDGCDGNCTPSTCGNTIAAGPEECDDGNDIDGDGCDAGCKLTRCGNGIATAPEECDDGNAKNGDGCDRNCAASRCGNGALSDGEECDDGNEKDGDGCDLGCRSTRCGNGVMTAGEACDDGNVVHADGCDGNCSKTACGNGVVTEGEQCDDGNADDDDGCDAHCRVVSSGRIFGGGLAFAGTALAASGIAIGITGSIPLIDHAAAAARLTEAEGNINEDPRGALDDARNLQDQLDDTNRRWRELGVPLVVGGAATLLVGVTLAAAGVWMWSDAAPSSANENGSDPNDEERVP